MPRIPRPALVALAIAAAALHARALSHPFLYDDAQVVANPDVRDLRRLPALFGRGYWQGMSGSIEGDQYRPLALVSLNLSFAASGDDPAGFRLVNLLLHAAASVLVALIG